MAKKFSRINRFSRRTSPAARESVMFRKENTKENLFFDSVPSSAFFKPAPAMGIGQTVQAKCTDCEKEDEKVQKQGKTSEEEKLNRMEEKQEDDTKVQGTENENELVTTPTYSERELVEQNTRHFANCDGVTVQGHTDANYGNSYSSPGSSTPSKDCDGCSDEDCVTNTGTVVSVFTTNPQITLPSVPAGLSECEAKAVENFINTTLMAHEQQHVAAFNTYRGTVKTPYTYKGCASGLDAHTRQIHDNIEAARKIRSDAKSAALDANGANIFHITCECPDPEPEADAEAESN
jgi:hypothetical protein